MSFADLMFSFIGCMQFVFLTKLHELSSSDRLYELQRQKEKLEEKIEQANKSLAENTPKKYVFI